MASHSCEYPIAIDVMDIDVADHLPLREPVMTWDAFALLLVMAFFSYAQ